MFMGKIRRQSEHSVRSPQKQLFLYVSSIYIALQAEGLPRLLSKAFLEIILCKKNDISGWGQALGFTNSGNLWAGKIFILSYCPLSLSRLAELLLHQLCLIFIRFFFFNFKKEYQIYGSFIRKHKKIQSKKTLLHPSPCSKQVNTVSCTLSQMIFLYSRSQDVPHLQKWQYAIHVNYTLLFFNNISRIQVYSNRYRIAIFFKSP